MMERLILTGLVAMALALPAFAESNADLERFRTTGICPGCNLEGADLRDFGFGEDGRPIDLRGANLKGANLVGVNFAGANLDGADLEAAELDTADFSGASLRGADLAGVTAAFTDFTRADLAGARMIGFSACYDQSFRDADLRGVDARGAVLCGGFWDDAVLIGADFRGADITLAVGLTEPQLGRACTDQTTKMDQRFTPNCD